MLFFGELLLWDWIGVGVIWIRLAGLGLVGLWLVKGGLVELRLIWNRLFVSFFHVGDFVLNVVSN